MFYAIIKTPTHNTDYFVTPLWLLLTKWLGTFLGEKAMNTAYFKMHFLESRTLCLKLKLGNVCILSDLSTVKVK